jgi:F-type H+-transporting ATPase subunit delta
MSVTRIASRYAKSLLDLAKENGKLEEIYRDVKDFSETVKNRDFLLMVKSPIINTDKKAQIFDTLFKNKYDKITSGFFSIILRKGREMYLPEIADQFISQYKVFKHVSTVYITTAVKIDDKNMAQIKSKLLASDITDDNVEIITKIDPNIMGGFVIEIGDKLYDASVAHNLDQLRKEFSDNLFVKTY